MAITKKTKKIVKAKRQSNVMVSILHRPVIAVFEASQINVGEAYWDVDDSVMDLSPIRKQVGRIKIGALAAVYDEATNEVHIGWSRCNYAHGDVFNDKQARKMAIGRATAKVSIVDIPPSYLTHKDYLPKFLKRIIARWPDAKIDINGQQWDIAVNVWRLVRQWQIESPKNKALASLASMNK